MSSIEVDDVIVNYAERVNLIVEGEEGKITIVWNYCLPCSNSD